MTPSNDFTRPPVPAMVRLARHAVVATVVGITLAGAGWTLGSMRTVVGPSVWAASVAELAAGDRPGGPTYVAGALVRPEGYERWVPVGASLGLSYSASSTPHEMFHQVLITPSAFEAFQRTGTFPEGTMLALEVRSLGSKVLPARSGLFADALEGLEFAVKDRDASPNGWAYYGFGDGSERTARAFPAGSCFTCHREHASTDNVFTQFYPRLRKDARGDE